MSQITPESECLQYTYDINSIEKDIQAISRWSNDTNLTFNSAKTKVMTISTPQMSKHHNLKKNK